MADGIVPQQPEPIKERGRRFDMRALRRLTYWGGAAALALAVVAAASQTESGTRRLTAALTLADIPARPAATVKIPPSNAPNVEVARLEAQVRTLAADRDRLANRLANLERNFDDITGSIKRQAAQGAIAPPAAKSPPPQISPPATAVAANTAAAEPEPAPKQATAPDQPAPPTPEKAVTAPAADETLAPGRMAVPLPRVRVAAAPATPPAPLKPEFGVALASASSLDVMRMQWAALKANYGPLLAGLRPLAAREPRAAGGHFRLVLGPLPNYAAAAKLCERLSAARAPCHAGKFAGEPV